MDTERATNRATKTDELVGQRGIGESRMQKYDGARKVEMIIAVMGIA
jgi:hypothetical protein